MEIIHTASETVSWCHFGTDPGDGLGKKIATRGMGCGMLKKELAKDPGDGVKNIEFSLQREGA